MSVFRRVSRGPCRVALVVALATSLTAEGASASQTPVPIGAEFQVNTETLDNQYDPAVGVGPGGEFVVVWSSFEQDGSEAAVYGQRFDSAGAAAGGEFRVAVATLGYQYRPEVAVQPSGEFVVVWEAYEDGLSYEVRARRFDTDGTALTGELALNVFTTSTQRSPSLGLSEGGAFVVVWDSFGQDGDNSGIVSRRFASDGTPVGGETVVNEVTAFGQDSASVAVRDDGSFVVAWDSTDPGYGQPDRVFARRVSSSGVPLGGDIALGSVTSASGFNPVVGAAANGSFVIAWRAQGLEGMRGAPGNPSLAQRFAADGSPIGGDFVVGMDTLYAQNDPAIAMDRDGNFVIAWSNGGDAADGDRSGIRARAFDADGDARGVEFVMNSYTPGPQDDVSLTVSGDGAFFAAWSGRQPGGDSGEILVRRFVTPPLFADGFETGEVCLWSTTVGDGDACV